MKINQENNKHEKQENLKKQEKSKKQEKDTNIYSKRMLSSSIVQRFLSSKSIKGQLYTTYLVALLIPIVIIGVFLIANTFSLLKSSHQGLVDSDNLRVKATFYEITTEVFYAADSIRQDSDFASLFSDPITDQDEFEAKADALLKEHAHISESELYSMRIYSDSPDFCEYKNFYKLTSEVTSQDWYRNIPKPDVYYWFVVPYTDERGRMKEELSLVQKTKPNAEGYETLLVVSVHEKYLRERIESSDFETVVFLQDEDVCYASNKAYYEEAPDLPIQFEKTHYSYSGDVKVDGETCIMDVVTQFLYQSECRLYICTINHQVYHDIHDILFICLIILAVAIIIPGLVIFFSAQYFSERVYMLRNEMHKASQGDYNIVSVFRGKDELSEAFSDLETMVQKIKEKDASMYEASINETELRNKQREMEFKMLASQINPHFLYNTLESIRMSAFTNGDREVANSIKMLGKSLRYVLDNTGTAMTTLDREVEYVENYIAIQRFRFGEKIGYSKKVDPSISLKDVHVLPLILQPIVENSILHGLEDKEEGGMIEMEIYMSGYHLKIEIRDNGCGMNQETLQKLRSSLNYREEGSTDSIGLYNTNQRLKRLYGARYGIQVDSKEGMGTKIHVLLPYIRTDSDKKGDFVGQD